MAADERGTVPPTAGTAAAIWPTAHITRGRPNHPHPPRSRPEGSDSRKFRLTTAEIALFSIGDVRPQPVRLAAMPKVVFLNSFARFGDAVMDTLSVEGWVGVTCEDGEAPPADAIAVVGGPDGMALFPQLPNLELLQVPFTGVDWLDEDTLPAGCTVANVHGMEGPISEYVLTGSESSPRPAGCLRCPCPRCGCAGPALAALLAHPLGLRPTVTVLESVTGFSKMDATYKSDAVFRSPFPPAFWNESKPVPFHRELAGCTVGIIGYGHIGAAVAKRALAFDMSVVGTARRKRNGPAPDGLDWLGTLRFQQAPACMALIGFVAHTHINIGLSLTEPLV